ncbi:hypothetical protein [Amphibiibacter pelophylacis]|uniref:Uncharacterized protein n=1 Tax=Amphibiibacter pelophylacis TaxID=1799477 RepID=A0ACC6P0P2_9BURK
MSYFAGSATVTFAGILWDTLDQSIGSVESIHEFAQYDQSAGTIGIPFEMILFGASTNLKIQDEVMTAASFFILATGILLFLSKPDSTENKGST